MNKKVKSGNSKLIVLLVLVMGLAVGILSLGKSQDTRSSAAGSCSGSVSHIYKPCTNSSNYPSCAGGPAISENSACNSFNGGCGYSFNKTDCHAVSLPGGSHFCDDQGSKQGLCSTALPTSCGGKRGSCSGSCPKGKTCKAPSVKGNGDNCSCR